MAALSPLHATVALWGKGLVPDANLLENPSFIERAATQCTTLKGMTMHFLEV